jgi:hypothetical protein
MISIVSSLLILIPTGGNDQEAERLQRQVLEYRKQLKSGHMVYRATIFDKGERLPMRDYKVEAWFDGSRVRNDLWLPDGHGSQIYKIYCYRCEKDNYVLGHDSSLLGTDIISTNLQPLNWYPDRHKSPYIIIDPRTLGLSTYQVGLLYRTDLDQENLLARKDQYNRVLERGRWQGKEAYKISYTASRGQKVSAWIVPAYGPSVVRLEIRSGDIFDWIECHYELYAGFWYPAQQIYERLQGGKSETKEIAAVEVLSLNKPLDPDPDIFRFRSMKIPANTRVSTDKGVMLWNGAELVPEEAPLRNVYRSGVGLRQWLLWGTSLVLALLAAFFVYRYFFRRGGQSASG